MEGTGFHAAIKRGILTRILQPIWKKKVFHVHADARQVLSSLSGDERTAAEEVLDLAERRGYLRCPAPSGQPRPAASV